MSKTTEPYLAGFWVNDMLEMLQECAAEGYEYEHPRVDGYELHLDEPFGENSLRHIVINTEVLGRVYDAVLASIKDDVEQLLSEGEIFFPLVSFFVKRSLDDFESGDQVQALLTMCVEYAKEG